MNPVIPQSASRHLMLLSGLSAVFVVFIHATTLKYDPSLGWESSVGVLEGMLSHNILHVALSVFFLNAAFFLFHGVSSPSHLCARLVRRLKTLALPYVAWSGLWLFLIWGFGRLDDQTSLGWLKIWLLTPLPGQFWFLRDLMFMVLFAPLIFLASNKLLIALAASTWVWWMYYQTFVVLDWRTSWYEIVSNEALSWFLLGAVAARFSEAFFDLIETGLSETMMLFLGLFWIFGSKLPFPMQIAHGLSVTAGTLFLLGAYPYLHRLAASRLTTVFAGYGFLIYAGHHPAISFIQAWLMRGTSGSQVWHLAVYLLTPLAIIAVLIFVFSMLSRFAPFVVFIANGGRPLPALLFTPQKDSA